MGDETRRRLAPIARGGLVLGVLTALLALEHRRPLRRRTEPTLRHDFRNLLFSVGTALTVGLVESPVVQPLARTAEARRRGLVPRLGLPRWAEVGLAVLLMDYTLYWWHVATHRVPLLWRFHKVHHVDRDLTASTALRFHFGEMVLSVPWRAAQVALIGVTPRALSLWQTLLTVSVLFHHSNLRLPEGMERRLVPFLVTPRMHGIHHSNVPSEMNANWSSGLMIWDRLHGTLRLDVPQRQITIGVPGQRATQRITLGRLVVMPFLPSRAGNEGVVAD
jgi:sterol desaturase/sphingolipid hydroxylase (fatty acid hydroxylase superfamily)